MDSTASYMAACRMARLRVGCAVAGGAPGAFWMVNSSWFQSTMVCPDPAVRASGDPTVPELRLVAHAGVMIAAASTAAAVKALKPLVLAFISGSPFLVLVLWVVLWSDVSGVVRRFSPSP